jgi:hypothetical protein
VGAECGGHQTTAGCTAHTSVWACTKAGKVHENLTRKAPQVLGCHASLAWLSSLSWVAGGSWLPATSKCMAQHPSGWCKSCPSTATLLNAGAHATTGTLCQRGSISVIGLSCFKPRRCSSRSTQATYFDVHACIHVRVLQRREIGSHKVVEAF